MQIIRDISAPGSDGRVIISAGKIDDRLKTNLRDELIKCCGIDPERAVRLADVVLSDVAQISGQKILSAARYANASREMIGLSVMRVHLASVLPARLRETSEPIWFSLDDYRSWFTSGKGKIADAVGVTVFDTGGLFEIFFQVGEAKFVKMRAKWGKPKRQGSRYVILSIASPEFSSTTRMRSPALHGAHGSRTCLSTGRDWQIGYPTRFVGLPS